MNLGMHETGGIKGKQARPVEPSSRLFGRPTQCRVWFRAFELNKTRNSASYMRELNAPSERDLPIIN
uniref:Uncharacterized protein n=1 Tax=Picea sitchensis TaxID=3332 RepID=A0A6B9XPR9_PICSI|nr:hypothetical protein Q903MT_gene3956 [Picea sitchensis]